MGENKYYVITQCDTPIEIVIGSIQEADERLLSWREGDTSDHYECLEVDVFRPPKERKAGRWQLVAT